MNVDLEQVLLDKAALMGKPLKATFELTPVCNLNCEMCYIRHSQKEADEKGGILPPTFWKSLIPELKKLGVLVVCLIGGEPFLYPDIESIYLELAKNGFLINITTNGTLLEREVPSWLIQHPPRYITVSLYGASNETYEQVTGNPKGFSMAIHGIENLRAAGIPVKLNFMVTPQNKHDLEKIHELKAKYQLPLLVSAYSLPANRKTDASTQTRLSSKECGEYAMKNKYLSDPEAYRSFCERVASGNVFRTEGLHTSCINCYAGKGMFWVTWQGNLLPCSMMTNISYSLKEEGLCAAWEKLRETVLNIKTSQSCASCKYREICLVCSGSMLTETGSFAGCPDYLCEATNEMVQIAKEYCNRHME